MSVAFVREESAEAAQEDVYLEDHWRLLGAIEAVILLGLTTAFLYAAIHQVWPLKQQVWPLKQN